MFEVCSLQHVMSRPDIVAIAIAIAIWIWLQVQCADWNSSNNVIKFLPAIIYVRYLLGTIGSSMIGYLGM
jgi:hypothetical protein